MILKRIEELSEKKYLPIVDPIRGRYLVDTIKRFSVKRVLEVGTLVGYSAILIAKNLPEDGKVFTIETNRNSAKMAKENIQMVKLSGKIEIFVGDAIQLIPNIREDFDMVFLDGVKGEYLDYLRVSEGKLGKGGIVFADNVKRFACDMRDYLDYVRNSGRYKSDYLDAGSDGVEISVKL